MRRIGLGIIGLGYIGKLHFRNSLKLKNVHLVAACDISSQARKKAESSGVKTYRNYEELLHDPLVEAVIISLPTHLHSICTKSAAEAGKNILLEKPIARNLKEANEIISAAKKNSVKLMIGYPLRFHEGFKNAKNEIDNGNLGEVELAHAVYISSGPFFHRANSHVPVPVPEWWWNKELTGGGVLIDIGSHLINLLRWYFGRIVEIKSSFGYRYNLDVEDIAVCRLKFESGTYGILSVGWYSQTLELEVKLLGSVRHLNIRHDPSSPVKTALRMLVTGTSGFHKPHLEEIQYFANCIINDVNPSPSGEDGMEDLKAITESYKNSALTRDYSIY